ncbi:Retrovirus-related Pol polyprotein from transposon TNT 1-94 [Cucumis melo var. makuwa]|uniref:Retrovirus-related Pol polyprotein from transposon TNT 1-94 n=1 Tax=Cucumis melo var. makuwa TaxID=1194695 RepID=A0A5D3C291_CUCMM|nr:Retrovirus-related Pol polyprotein from transposon TNT 1-94 [Cucumis melo var. makuwa]
MSIDQLMGSLQAHEEKLFKKNKQMAEQLFQSKLKLKDKEDNLEKGNRDRGRGGNCRRGDRGRGSYSQRKFDKSNLNSNSSKGQGRQHYSRSSRERSNNDRRNKVEENANYAEKDEESGDSSLFLACKGAKTCENSAWYLDSGASNHMCGSKSMFVEFDEFVGGDIVFGDATKIPVKGKDPNWIWHLRFGHLNFDSLRLLARKDMVKGLPYVKHPDQLCEGYLDGKQSRKSFPQESSSRARRPVELVHTDLCGLIKPSSFGKNNYFLLFIDAFTRKTWVYFVKEKSEVFDMFKRFKALVEKESGYYIKALRSDRGGEFTSNEFKTFYTENKIRRPMTVPFTPQQNGVVERKNRTIINMAQNMLKCKKMPKEFWAQVVECAVYLSNRSPTRSLWNKSPQQAWTGRKPSIAHLIVFRCMTYSYIPDQKRKDYKFLFFPNDHDEPSDIASPLTTPTSPITQQQSTSSSSASSSEGEPLNFEEALQNDKWKIAMDEEIKAIKKNDTWELSTLPNGKKAMDVKSAFLNGYLEEEVYLEQPPGYSVKDQGDKVLKLKKALYRLKQTPRMWNSRINKYCSLIMGNCASMFKYLKKAMTQEFEMTDIELMSYNLGIEVKQSEEDIFISQERYTREILEKFNMINSKPVTTSIETGTKLFKHEEGDDVDPSYFKSLVGSLRYLTCTRLDILFSVGLVSQFMESPTTTHLKVAKRILRYLKGTLDYELFYFSSKEFKLEGYCESDWAGDTND